MVSNYRESHKILHSTAKRRINILFNFFPFIFSEAFHDCVGPNGCDGCLNLNNPDNAGLDAIITRLGKVRKGDGEQTFTVSSDFIQYKVLIFPISLAL